MVLEWDLSSNGALFEMHFQLGRIHLQQLLGNSKFQNLTKFCAYLMTVKSAFPQWIWILEAVSFLLCSTQCFNFGLKCNFSQVFGFFSYDIYSDRHIEYNHYQIIHELVALIKNCWKFGTKPWETLENYKETWLPKWEFWRFWNIWDEWRMET